MEQDIDIKDKILQILKSEKAPKGNVETSLKVALYALMQLYPINIYNPQAQSFLFYALDKVGYKESKLHLNLDIIHSMLDELVKDGSLVYIDEYSSYIASDEILEFTAKVYEGKSVGEYYVKDLEKINNYTLYSNFNLHAGDEVLVTADNFKKVAYVKQIVTKSSGVLGYLRRTGSTFVVEPCDSNNGKTYEIASKENLRGAQEGDIVIAKFIQTVKGSALVVKEVVKDLGKYNKILLSAILKYDIPNIFAPNMKRALSRIKDDVDLSEMKGRVDLRELPLVTIDGEDARDFDDAVYCKKEGTKWRLYVAIADVSYYVKPNTVLDAEALNRCNSVYFPNYVIPMLPKKLSNGICSLNPHVDRLCMVCEMVINGKGTIEEYAFYPAVMNSHARLTYTQAHSMIEQGTIDKEEYKDRIDDVKELYKLYKVLKRAREIRGGISVEGEEVHIIFDEQMDITAIEPYVRNESHMLIEECMIAANVAAASFVEKNGGKTLYRVHAKPSVEKLNALRNNLLTFGLTLGGGDSPANQDFAVLAKQIAKREDKSIIEQIVLQSMSKAIYSPDNIGHFGLALEKYAHFTSPIRRYPDLQLHRVVKHILEKKKTHTWGRIGAKSYTKEELKTLGERCTQREIAADMAEHDVDNELKCEFLKRHIGECVQGTVTALVSFGIFVRLNNFYIDGLIFIGNLPKGEMHDNCFEMPVAGGVQKIHVGSQIKVVIAAVDSKTHKVDLFLEQKGNPILKNMIKESKQKFLQERKTAIDLEGDEFSAFFDKLMGSNENEEVTDSNEYLKEHPDSFFEKQAKIKRQNKKKEKAKAKVKAKVLDEKKIKDGKKVKKTNQVKKIEPEIVYDSSTSLSDKKNTKKVKVSKTKKSNRKKKADI